MLVEQPRGAYNVCYEELTLSLRHQSLYNYKLIDHRDDGAARRLLSIVRSHFGRAKGVIWITHAFAPHLKVIQVF
jgi:hypothetical protein